MPGGGRSPTCWFSSVTGALLAETDGGGNVLNQYIYSGGRRLAEAYTYDAASNRTAMTYPASGSTTYSYDSLNRLTGLTDSSSGAFGFGYDALGRRTSLTRPNGVSTSYAYDNLSRLRRLVVCDRYFFVACNRLRTRAALNDDDFEILARVIEARRGEHGFLITAWVFLPDHWHAILGPRYPLSVSRVLETLKVASTRRINARQKMSGRLWQGRFFDRALRTVKEYSETVEYIHRNPVRRGLVARPEDWRWSSVHEYGPPGNVPPLGWSALRIDRVRIPADPKTRI